MTRPGNDPGLSRESGGRTWEPSKRGWSWERHRRRGPHRKAWEHCMMALACKTAWPWELRRWERCMRALEPHKREPCMREPWELHMRERCRTAWELHKREHRRTAWEHHKLRGCKRERRSQWMASLGARTEALERCSLTGG